ncbi:rhodanese-like domain-containing protein [Aestuariirhabdus sp. Z084]|uniref:rhodanese-like domain-containing protein n=1 Tax=Aestuariirhabdus haliotis TaxID=2918751 RepID=UPI00201B3530|nr:rhodanese-like domain-containing protein [Aestuariirhabdus haliotis]MCL6416690.1 rhodanese-like domain-containing protein [Aestuariirhabdus haliotis]MCL6420721.1 rhodanese-like domain-containing protein [Aestuariirhabdus haliotis]
MRKIVERLTNTVGLALLLVSMSSLAAQPEPGDLVIDVRSEAEFSGGHYPGALNISYERIAAQILSITENRDQPIALYCQSGRRAGIAKETLHSMGFTQVTNYGGLSDISKH